MGDRNSRQVESLQIVLQGIFDFARYHPHNREIPSTGGLAINIEVLFLGPAKDLAGVETAKLDLPDGATVAVLRDALRSRYSALAAGLDSMRIAVDQTFAPDDTVVTPGAEVALIPPVSGGCDDPSTWVELVREAISTQRIQLFVEGHVGCGAINTFMGATRRDHHELHGEITKLEYEAYEPMARRELERLANEARSRWSLERVVLIHRLGLVPLGDLSVVVAVAAPHRSDGFDACRWLIDRLKEEVPIWKKDVFADGITRWVDPSNVTSNLGWAVSGSEVEKQNVAK